MSIKKLNAPDQPSLRLLEDSIKIYPRAVTGVFSRWRWGVVWLTQLVFYGLPWLTWNDRAAVLFDLGARKFYIFGLILYPQDFIYLTGLLVICAMSLFLFTTVAGRLWCGFACPQTVYTEIFMWVERVVEGDRTQRMKLDAGTSKKNRPARKTLKIFIWVCISLLTGFTFVGYFTPITELLTRIVAFDTSAWQTFWILFYAFATFGNAGFMREQVCKYMCPYARFQGVMCDPNTLMVTYDSNRGDPRGSRSRKSDPRQLGLGDCIDCGLCVQVCPVGIDIRDGQQYECIGCAACIDVCDQVMAKIEYPKKLIRFDTLKGMEDKTTYSLKMLLFRPRVLLYTFILLTTSTIILGTLVTRVDLKVDIMRDRATLAREVDRGVIENVFQLMVINSAERTRSFNISVEGIDDIYVDSDAQIEVSSGSHRLVPVRVRAKQDNGRSGSNEIHFSVSAVDDSATVKREKTVFFFPHLP